MRLPASTLPCLFGFALATAAPAAIAQDGGRTIPYAALYAPLAAVKQADPLGIVTSSVCAESAQADVPLPGDLKVELRDAAGHHPLPLDAHDCITLPPRVGGAVSDAEIWINQPRQAVKLVEAFAMRTPTATHISYGQLMESLPVIERLATQPLRIGGLPTQPPQGVELAWPPGTAQRVTVGTGASEHAWTTDTQGHLRIPFDSTLPASTPVVLSTLPSALQPYSQ
ncbi:MAG: hypothetical protein JSS44_04800 [Proteobacteria bacterium]|nr:hypothetical protein [Pseudomonadota bacterium]MBS0464249.1 hypothetical protein [Pseudomonadota bacterium]